MSRRRFVVLIACGAALFGLALAGVQFQQRDDLNGFLVVTGLQAAIYLIAVWLVWNAAGSRRAALTIAVLAIAMRVPVVFAPPYLSADVYRYIWDGRIEAAGFNPYRYEPVDPQLAALRDADIFPQIGSPYAPTIYPPAAEAIFLIVTRVSESATAMKLAMVAFEAVTVALLVRLLMLEGLPATWFLVYAWHPLALWEFAGSGHIDAALITFCVGALFAVRRDREGLAGFFASAATLIKFYPLVLLPALYRRWDWRLPLVFLVSVVIAYSPFMSAGRGVLGFLPGYARQEGLNGQGAGFYLLGLLRRLPGLDGLDAKIYVIAAIVALGALSVGLMFRRDSQQPPYAMAAVLAVAFTIAVSPHYPWYFAWLIVFACFLRSLALLWLTNACLLLYLMTEHGVAPSTARLTIETTLYGLFGTLALVDLWYYRRRATRHGLEELGHVAWRK